MKLCFNRRVAFLSQPLVQYRWHADNETHRYRFDRGVREIALAGRKVLAEYRQHPGRAQEAEWLHASVEALAKVHRWAAELETSKAWLEEQVRNWQQEAEQRERALTELRTWTVQLETSKAWLEEQVRNWQQEAEQRERTLTELRTWTAQLEAAKAWLEEQVRNWQQEAEQREALVADLRAKGAEREAATVRLEEQVRNWQREAEQREALVLEHRRALESLHTRIAVLEHERAKVGRTLDDLEEQAWTRIGRRLRLLSGRQAMETNTHE
ncbi:MAG: hypothetical protein M5R38_06805 [Candidatus Methylomirabilis sp.]|nr:hypothetical protein [Candidatus Methylomirabilis sp.]